MFKFCISAVGKKRKALGIFFLLHVSMSSHVSSQTEAKPIFEATVPAYRFTIMPAYFTMKDGIRLSASIYKPDPRFQNEKFPVLFEFLPYHKDDHGYMENYPVYSYFAKRGFIMARVDIRGNGASDSTVPLREYSEQELDDAVEIIDQLPQLPDSNGNVGMWGISWGGFSSIQVAIRRPPSLKAILATEAADDLYHDDVHHMDGAFHLDQFIPYVDNLNALPKTPAYPLDEAYFRDRFNHYPWFLTYTKYQLDGDFWRKNSLRWQSDKIRVPCYLIGGLLDGYRDSIPRMLENMKVPIRATIGPYNHNWPDSGVPGPNYEWRHEAVRWWDYWLKGRNMGIMKDPPLALFIREGQGPDVALKTTPGHWVFEEWPIKGTTWKQFFPSEYRRLQNRPGKPGVKSLRYVPSFGVQTGLWWGEPTGDLRPDDAGALVFDSPAVKKKFEIAGFPKVHLRVSADAPLAHWVARLEDVQPDGTVSLVTGMLLNGSQRTSRLKPEPLVPGEVYDLEFEMHFTTWTFKPLHCIRLAVSNSLFPMIWPTPYLMTTKLHLGVENTRLELPILPQANRKAPAFRPPEPREIRTDARELGGAPWPQGLYEWKRDLWSTKTSVKWKGDSEYEIQGRRCQRRERNYHETNDQKPAESRFSGEAAHQIKFEGRALEIRSTIDVISDKDNFYITVVRYAFENGALIRKREWKETVPRIFN